MIARRGSSTFTHIACSLIWLVTTTVLFGAGEVSTRPNILFVTADDSGLQLSCYGDQTAHTPQQSPKRVPPEDAEVVITHFGDSTCSTSYLPKDQRIETVLNNRLSAAYPSQRITGHNVATGGDFIRRFLDSGRYERVVRREIPRIDIALIRYGHNDHKHCEPKKFKQHLEEFCDRLEKDYPGITIILETNTWVDPQHYSGDSAATARLNKGMNSAWDVVRSVAAKRKYPLVENYDRKKKETKKGNWDQRIRNQELSIKRFQTRILDGAKDEEMASVPGWYVDNHPNANGVKVMADEEFNVIRDTWPMALPTSGAK